MVPGTPCIFSVQLFEFLKRIVGIARVVPLETGVDTHRKPNPAHLESAIIYRSVHDVSQVQKVNQIK